MKGEGIDGVVYSDINTTYNSRLGLPLRGGVVVFDAASGARPTPTRETGTRPELDQEGPALRRRQAPSDEDIICAPNYTWNCDDALAVFHGPTPSCETGESGGDWRATNGPNLIGGFQIDYPSHTDKLFAVTGSYDRELLFDPHVNTDVAHLVFLAASSSWSPWPTCRPDGISLPNTGVFGD